MFCKYCGTSIDEDSVFCVKCGRNITAIMDTTPPTMDTHATATEPFRSRVRRVLRLPEPITKNRPYGLTWYSILMNVLLPLQIIGGVGGVLKYGSYLSGNLLSLAVFLLPTVLHIVTIILIWIDLAWRNPTIMTKIYLHIFVLSASFAITLIYYIFNSPLPVRNILEYALAFLIYIGLMVIPTARYIKKRVPYYFL